MDALLGVAIICGLPFILGIAFGWWLRARLRPNAQPDTPATDRQRSYLEDLAKRPSGPEVLAALAITDQPDVGLQTRRGSPCGHSHAWRPA